MSGRFDRSQLSSNWRVKDNASSIEGGPPSPHPKSEHGLGRHCHSEISSKSPIPPRGKQSNDKDAERALQDGRRLYVGSVPYMAKTGDIALLFAGKFEVEHISMSLDPFTGRNPGYCFVNLQDRSQIDEAIQTLNGSDVLGRPIKINLGVPKSSGVRLKSNGQSSDRQKIETTDSYDRWNRNDAENHWKGYSEQGRRVFVGGLPRMSNHYDVEKGMREFFRGYNIECVSKVVVPPSHDRGKPDKRGWDDRYVFVDFTTSEEADRAVQATNGTQSWGVKAWEQEEEEKQIPGTSQEYPLSHPSFEDEEDGG